MASKGEERLMYTHTIRGDYSHSGISTLRMEIGSVGFFQCFGVVHGHTKPIGIERKYSVEPFLIGGWMVGG